MTHVITPPIQPSVAVSQSNDSFPVHRIYCVGKNYAAHIREMGGDPERQPPCFFMKPADAVVTGAEVAYPLHTSSYHYEAELVIAIGKAGTNIPLEKALDHVYGYAIGLDMTRRDLQTESSQSGLPWDTGKAFDQSAPISTIFPVSEVGHFVSGSISLAVNGELRQDADFKELIWKNDEIIAELSTFYTLQPGDLIFTGTPAGVGPVVRGDCLEVKIERLGCLSVTIT